MKRCYQMSSVYLFLIACQIVQISYGEAKPADAVTITSTDEVSTAMIAADGVPIPTAMAMFTDYSGHNVQRDDNNNSTMGKVAANVKDNFISAGKDLASSMMAAAPYLPLVYKIAVFIVPGLSSYYILLYAVNVAAITAQAVQNYQSGQSMTSVTSEAGMKLLYNSLSKRDIIDTEGDQTSNIRNSLSNFYTSLKDMCRRVTSFGRNTQEENSQSTTYTAISNNNDLETPATAIIVKNVETKTGNDKDGIVEITSSMTKMTYKNHGVLKQIKKMVRNEDDVSSSSESKLDEESSDSSEKNDTDHIVEIDEADFQTLLMESMALQPTFIQRGSGEQLVDFMNHLTIKLPEPRIDSKKLFEDLNIVKNITEEKKTELNEMMGKITDYYIAMALMRK